jgi:hypothetical protein
VTDATLKKIKSEIVSTSITTDAIIYTAATGGTTEEYDDGGKRYKPHLYKRWHIYSHNRWRGTDDRNKVDYLIIAGGAGGWNS